MPFTKKYYLNELEVIKKYNETKSLRDTAAFFKVSIHPINDILNKSNILKNSSRKYYCNEHYFENIDTEEKAYWLGYLYADGYVRKRYYRNSYNYEFRFKLKDREMLEWLNKSLESNYPIKPEKGTNCYSITIGSKILVNDLIKQGCVPNKSLILIFPNEQQVKPELYRHFIRGYFDGDGCISFNFDKNRFKISIAGTSKFLDKISEVLSICSNYKKEVIKQKKSKIHILSYGGINQVTNIFKWLYCSSNIYLLRKFVRFKEISVIENLRKIYVQPKRFN